MDPEPFRRSARAIADFNHACAEVAVVLENLHLRLTAEWQAERAAVLFEGRVPASLEVFSHEQQGRGRG